MKPMRPRINRRKLKELREARGWSGIMAAAHIGITKQALDYIERGLVRCPHPLTLERIAKTYNVAVDDLVS